MNKKELNEMLFKACDREEIEKAKEAIELGADVNSKNEYEQTPLHIAASRNFGLGVAKILIENGADIEAKNDFGQTPLYGAVAFHNLELVDLLIKKGANVEVNDVFGHSPVDILHFQVKNRYIDEISGKILKLLQEKNNNYNKIIKLNKLKLKFKKLSDTAIIPTQAHEGDCFDLFSDENITINSFESKIIHTNIAFDIPDGYRIKIFSRSSLPLKKQLIVSNAVGIIDTGYKDGVGLICHSLPLNKGFFIKRLINNPVQIHKGDKIAQFQLEKIVDFELEEVEELDITNNRGGGFGSTNGYNNK